MNRDNNSCRGNNSQRRRDMLYFLTMWVCLHVSLALFPHGPEAGDTEITSDRSALVSLSPAFPFYSLNLSSVTVYRDAFICFDNITRDLYLLEKNADVNFPVITVWASAVRTRHNGGVGSVTYRLSTNETLLRQISQTARNFSEFTRTFYPIYAVVVTWLDVGTVLYEEVSKQKTNTFQVLLATDGRQSLVRVEYSKMEWIYDGPVAMYDYNDIVEFTRAQVGFYSGDESINSLLPVSFTPGVRDITTLSNVNISGVYIFRTDTAPVNLTMYNPSYGSTDDMSTVQTSITTDDSSTEQTSTFPVHMSTVPPSTSKDMSTVQTSTSKNMSAVPTSTSKDTSTVQPSTSKDMSPVQTSTSKNMSTVQTSTAKNMSTVQTSPAKDMSTLQTSTSKNILTVQTSTTKNMSTVQTSTSKNMSTVPTSIPTDNSSTVQKSMSTSYMLSVLPSISTNKMSTVLPSISTSNMSTVQTSMLSTIMSTGSTQEATDNTVPDPIAGMIVVFAVLALITIVALILVCRLQVKNRRKRFHSRKVGPEEPITAAIGNGHLQPAPTQAVSRVQLHSASSAVSSAGIRMVEY